MKKYFPFLIVILFFAAGAIIISFHVKENKAVATHESESDLSAPSEHFFLVRSYPDAVFDYKGYEQAMTQTKQLADEQKLRKSTQTSWVLEGPGNIGGRVNVIAVHPTNQNIMFAGCAAGGIFKTVDAGNNWVPVFDNSLYLSIGCIEFDPNNSGIMYAGTGDPNISGYPFIGDGIYKSTDGGNTWSHLGLTAQRIVSKIIVDPNNSNIIYAATMGLPFVRDNNRGLYKSTDGGATWNNILFINNESGIIDLMMSTSNSQILYAAGWNRIRSNQESLITGQAAKIYKTTNGGVSWTILTGGLPQGDMSRIGLAMSGTNPNVLFASYVDTTLQLEGIYKSTNAGVTWNPVPTFNLPGNVMGGFGWYFGKIAVNPTDDNEIYVLAIDLYATYDGGQNWQLAAPIWWTYQVHADKHDFVFLNPSSFLLATDGGIYRTDDGGFSWYDIENIPNTQFYRVAINPFEQGVFTGGAQDNGTTKGNYNDINNWPRIFGGDGFQARYNPSNPDDFWFETQNGAIWVTNDGGFNFNDGTLGIDTLDRRNWDAPIIMSSSNPDVLYTATYRVYQNTSGSFPFWTPISNDLTDGIIFEPRFHTISALAESPVNTNFLYAGTTDANVWRSLNGGNSWDNVTSTLPDRYVTSVHASTVSAGTVYVTHSGYRYNDFIPHIHKSTDNGTSWTNISGDLPPAAVNDILPFPGNENILFAATDAGVYFTTNAGINWSRAGDNMPIIPVYDIEYDSFSHKVIAGTHARSMQSISIDTLLLGVPRPIASTPFNFNAAYNSNSNSLSIKISGAESGKYFLNIYSVSGALLGKNALEISSSLFESEIAMPSVGSGIYFVMLSGNSVSGLEKFMVRK